MKRYVVVFLLGAVVGAVVQHNRDMFDGPMLVVRTWAVQAFDIGPDFHWTMVDVNHAQRQGDAHLVQVRGGKTILIDAGYRDPARERLVPLLRERSVTRIDHVFISHAHRDHYEGLIPLLNSGVEIGEVSFSVPSASLCDAERPWGCHHADASDHVAAVIDAGIPVSVIQTGQRFDLGNGVALTALFAPDAANPPPEVRRVNGLSQLMLLTSEGVRILFTGDIDEFTGAHLTEHLADALAADVLKVPHHGGRSLPAESFFEKVKPRYALVPAPQWLWCDQRAERARSWLDAQKVPVYVNGFSGHVEVIVDDGAIEIVPEQEAPIDCASLARAT